MKSIALVGTLLVTLVASGCGPAAAPVDRATLQFRYSHFVPDRLTVPVGVPVTITLQNDDPIEHEWIVGSSAVHATHRVGTEPKHDEIPTEVSVLALSSRVTRVTFDKPGEYAFICHLPGHEAYGMKGTLIVR
jgi:uncharacterized cupredoxin-like copper-binding protein